MSGTPGRINRGPGENFMVTHNDTAVALFDVTGKIIITDVDKARKWVKQYAAVYTHWRWIRKAAIEVAHTHYSALHEADINGPEAEEREHPQ